MTRPSLGITAMELFACNPFRVLGIAVDTPTADVTLTYKKLLDMAAKGDTADYETPYDFDFLPPFSRSEKDLKTAYAKIASNGYRCFAFSDPIFSASLNIDDVMLNLRDISCYDCFLRCYMWLITNDRDFEEPELWIPLCQYIDKMIMSSPDQWEKYFDHRFPQDMLDGSMSALRSFYATFCDIILLPIKEMVRGSMKCRSAMEILKIAKVDVDEVFPDIDIPQANLPKRGEPAPKLKIAVKDGEEYYDVTTGKMVNFEGDEDSAIESNDFSAAASSISADAIVGFVEDLAHLGVDDVAAGQALVKLQVADEVAQRRGREVLDRKDRLLDAIGVELRVGDLVVNDGVDLHGDVVLRDDGLRREVRDLLFERQTLGDRLDERDLQVQADAPCGLVGAEAGDDVSLCLRDDADVAHENDERDQDDSVENVWHGDSSLFFCARGHAGGCDDELDALDAQHDGRSPGGDGDVRVGAGGPDLPADGHGAAAGQVIDILRDEAFLPDEHIGIRGLGAAVDIFFHQRARHGEGRDRHRKQQQKKLQKKQQQLQKIIQQAM